MNTHKSQMSAKKKKIDSELYSFYQYYFGSNVINPLVPEFCIPLIFEILTESGSYRLPTHRRDAHRKFFR